MRTERLSGEDILATQHVTRWHMVRTRRHQTLAEHLAVVTMFTVKLATYWGIPPEEFPALIDEALTHDAHEVEFGDMPSIAKAFARAGHVENAIEGFFWRNRGAEPPMSESPVVKLADALEALIFYTLEGEDRDIRRKLEDRVEERLKTAPEPVAYWVRTLLRRVQEGTFTPQPDRR